MRRGDTFVFDVQVFAPPPQFSPPGAQGGPLNITGYSMWFTAKYHTADPDQQAVTQQTVTGGGIVFTNALQGMAEITVPALATFGFPDGVTKLVYDVQIKDLQGRISTVEVGTLSVYPDVTNATS